MSERVAVPAWVIVVVVLALLATVVALVVGLGDDDDGAVPGSTTTATTAATTTSEASTTTTAPQATTSTTSTPPAALGDFPVYATEGASGSGCSPGAGALPDGWWFGDLPDGLAGPVVTFDLMCFFVGDAAVEAAVEDGYEPAIEEGFVENDYWIRNENETLRDVPVSAAVETLCVALDPADAARPVPCGRAEVAEVFDVWLRVSGGQVDRAVEQFVP